ncbi:ATP synthase-coupling factor 6, mitochondrial [Manis javanica]|nr:ATP synthase-coupling factor 6, mitochondrial [Manis javanica]
MILQRLFRFSCLIQSAVSVHLRRNIGVAAVAFKEIDPTQKLFLDKIRDTELSDSHLEDLLILVQSISRTWRGSFLRVSKCMVKETWLHSLTSN